MPKLVIQNLNNKEILIKHKDISILLNLAQAGQDWMMACGGKGRCTTCAFIVLEGENAFSNLTEAEINFRTQGRLPENQRLACQTFCMEDATIQVPAKNKLPHLKYDD